MTRAIVLDLARRAARDDAAGVEHDHLVGDAHDQRHVVLDHHDGDAAVAHRAQQLGELGGLGVVESRRRLVEQQQARPRHQRAHHLQELLPAHRQIGGGHVAERREPDEIQERIGLRASSARSSRRARGRARASAARPRARTMQMRARQHVLERGHAGKDRAPSGRCA